MGQASHTNEIIQASPRVSDSEEEGGKDTLGALFKFPEVYPSGETKRRKRIPFRDVSTETKVLLRDTFLSLHSFTERWPLGCIFVLPVTTLRSPCVASSN